MSQKLLLNYLKLHLVREHNSISPATEMQFTIPVDRQVSARIISLTTHALYKWNPNRDPFHWPET